ncbi:MAG: ROK family protein [Bacilli bacterium]|nr:ROK family protein [Bacilli bacterium]
MANKLHYDEGYVSPFEALNEFEDRAYIPLEIAIKRFSSLTYVYKSKITDDLGESFFYVKKIILSLIWMVGGNEIILRGHKRMYEHLMDRLSSDVELKNSQKGMETVYKVPFIFSYSDQPLEDKEMNILCSASFKGNRIGFDAGGSDRKVSAVKDGKLIYSEEVLWLPKEQKDWHYHYDGILSSLKKAASKLDHVDAIGVSTAGIIDNDEVAQSNLFILVNEEDTSKHVRTIFKDIARDHFKGVPIKVSNDGDVTALGGELMYGNDHILGIAMGTSEAAGYSKEHSFNGWINELGKVPMNYADEAVAHYATGIVGAGSEYLSQKGIIRLAKKAGFVYQGTLAERLSAIQKEDSRLILYAYEDMGVYLAHAIAYYSKFLDIRSVLLLGRVMSGQGGEIILSKSKEILKELKLDIDVFSADERFKRLGQSYTDAALPKI